MESCSPWVGVKYFPFSGGQALGVQPVFPLVMIAPMWKMMFGLVFLLWTWTTIWVSCTIGLVMCVLQKSFWDVRGESGASPALGSLSSLVAGGCWPGFPSGVVGIRLCTWHCRFSCARVFLYPPGLLYIDSSPQGGDREMKRVTKEGRENVYRRGETCIHESILVNDVHKLYLSAMYY